MKKLVVIVFLVACINSLFARDRVALSQLKTGATFTLLQKVNVYIPTDYFVQDGTIKRFVDYIDVTRPYCRFSPRASGPISIGSVFNSVKFSGEIARISYKKPFFYTFDMSQISAIKRIRCMNGKDSGRELYVDDLLSIIDGVFSFEYKYNSGPLDNGSEAVYFDKGLIYRFDSKLGFFENLTLYFQKGEVKTSIVDLDNSSYCSFSTHTKEMVIHPGDLSKAVKISGSFVVDDLMAVGFVTRIAFRDIDLVASCYERRAAVKTSRFALKSHFGKYLTIDD